MRKDTVWLIVSIVFLITGILTMLAGYQAAATLSTALTCLSIFLMYREQLK